MTDAFHFILEAQGYLSQLTAEVDLESTLCDDDDLAPNNTTISMFLESGNTDGSEKPSNDELKSKATTAHKNALQKILDTIKAFIKKIIDFFKNAFGGKDSVQQSMHAALDAAKTVIPDAGNTKIEILDKRSLFKDARTRIKELDKARKTHDRQKIDAAKKNLQVSLDAIKNGKAKTITVSLQEALKMVEESEDNTKRDTIELQKLQAELEKIESKISTETAISDNADIAAAQFQASAQMMIAADAQKEAQGTTTTFFGAIKSIRKLIKSDSSMEKAQAVAEIMDAAANNPRVNKFCKGASKVGSVLFDDIGKQKSGVVSSLQRAQGATSDAQTKSGIGKVRAKGRALGGYATALNGALNDPHAVKVIGSVGNVGKKSIAFANKVIDGINSQLDDEDDED